MGNLNDLLAEAEKAVDNIAAQNTPSPDKANTKDSPHLDFNQNLEKALNATVDIEDLDFDLNLSTSAFGALLDEADDGAKKHHTHMDDCGGNDAPVKTTPPPPPTTTSKPKSAVSPHIPTIQPPAKNTFKPIIQKPPVQTAENNVAQAPHPNNAPTDDTLKKENETLKAEIEALQASVKSLNDRLIRTAADFDNYRKRVIRDQESAKNQAEEKIVLGFLPVIDNLERAIAHAQVSHDFGQFQKGVEMTHKLYVAALAKLGCTPFNSLGAVCDPVYHDVLQRVVDEEKPHNSIIQEHLKGYMMHERVIRPALVVVSQHENDDGQLDESVNSDQTQGE